MWCLCCCEECVSLSRCDLPYPTHSSLILCPTEAEDFEEKLKELEDVCNPVIQALYQKHGGPSGGADGSGFDEDEDIGSHDEL